MKKKEKIKQKEKEEKSNHVKKQIIWIVWTTIIMGVGLILFKYIPMYFYGKDIFFDASSHVVWTGWGLYVLWFFVDQKKAWRIPYLIFSAVILVIMSIQRIVANQHNEIGVMLGLIIILIAIILPRWKEFKGGIEF